MAWEGEAGLAVSQETCRRRFHRDFLAEWEGEVVVELRAKPRLPLGSRGFLLNENKGFKPLVRRKAMSRAVMVQGTGSGVGKSVIVAAFCRIFARRGYRVSPFKAQNMALNSYVTRTGGEIGRSTAVQAMAAGVTPITAMNPILLKPKADTTSQLIVMGKPVGDFSAAQYFKGQPDILRRKMNVVRRGWKEISSSFDIVVIEGAGSPAEINLRRQDVVNMRTAKMANARVILVADIDKGGAFASLAGTYSLLTPSERKQIGAFLLNKFRGDPALLGGAAEEITKRTGVPFLGVIPYIHGLGIQEEDAVPAKVQGCANPVVKIGVIYLPHISNFTDLDPLAWEPGVQLIYISEPCEIGGVDAIILPGTKNTTGDLKHLQVSQIAQAIIKVAQKGLPVVGICGGYQMLGKTIEDEEGLESSERSVPGLDLLPVKTYFHKKKMLRQATFSPAGTPPFLSDRKLKLEGYEIHHGRTRRLRGARPAFSAISDGGAPEGCVNTPGTIFGSYLHDLFENDRFRRNFINSLRKIKGLKPISDPLVNASSKREGDFDLLADTVLKNIDMKLLDQLVGLETAS